jgi:hypothetical protein
VRQPATGARRLLQESCAQSLLHKADHVLSDREQLQLGLLRAPFRHCKGKAL